MRNTADVTGGNPIAVLLQSISGVSANDPLVAFYDIHGRKREVLFFYFVPDTTRDHDELAMRNTAHVTGSKPIAVCFQSVSSMSTDNALGAFYDNYGSKVQRVAIIFLIHHAKQPLFKF
jgi:hypothetical protein